MLVQMGEEKVQLAIQGYALVDKHLAVITQHVKVRPVQGPVHDRRALAAHLIRVALHLAHARLQSVHCTGACGARSGIGSL